MQERGWFQSDSRPKEPSPADEKSGETHDDRTVVTLDAYVVVFEPDRIYVGVLRRRLHEFIFLATFLYCTMHQSAAGPQHEARRVSGDGADRATPTLSRVHQMATEPTSPFSPRSMVRAVAPFPEQAVFMQAKAVRRHLG